jgi:hypothetical protein
MSLQNDGRPKSEEYWCHQKCCASRGIHVSKRRNLLIHLNSFLLTALELTNSVARVRERTIPTERLPLVGEVSANLC